MNVHIGFTVIVVSFICLVSPLEAVKVLNYLNLDLFIDLADNEFDLVRNWEGGGGVAKVKMLSTFQTNFEKKQSLDIQKKNNNFTSNDFNYFSTVRKTLTVGT